MTSAAGRKALGEALDSQVAELAAKPRVIKAKAKAKSNPGNANTNKRKSDDEEGRKIQKDIKAFLVLFCFLSSPHVSDSFLKVNKYQKITLRCGTISVPNSG